MTRPIYYLPGQGGRLHTGLGEGLLSRGFNVAGRETVGEFRSLPFQEQIEAVAEDLSTLFLERGPPGCLQFIWLLLVPSCADLDETLCGQGVVALPNRWSIF